VLNQRDYQKAFGPPDPAFARAVRGKVMELTRREEPVMRRKLRVSLLIAALILALLAAATLAAASRWGILDFFKLYEQPIQPLSTAEGIIQRDLGFAEDGRLRMAIREAVYDGMEVRAVVEVAPAEGAKLMLLGPWGSPDDQTEDGSGTTYAEKAEAEGKTAYPVDYPALMEVPGGAKLTFQDPRADVYGVGPWSDLYVREGESILFCLTGAVSGAPDSIRLAVGMNEPHEGLKVAFELKKSGRVTTVRLAPERAAPPEAGCEVRSAALHITSLVGYAEVNYALTPRKLPAFGEETTVYATKNGRYFHRVSGCSGMENALPQAAKEAKANGKAQCPVCFSREPLNDNLSFELLDQDGNRIGLEDAWVQRSDRGKEAESYRLIGVFEASGGAQAAYALRPYDWQTGERYESIPLTAAP